MPSTSAANRAPRSALVVPLVLLAVSLAGAVFSAGVLDADEVAHFLIARQVPGDPTLLLDIWGRPLCTALYTPLAPLGLTAARLLAVGITALTGLGTLRLAGALAPLFPPNSTFNRHRAAWLWLLLFAQPLFLLSTFTVMTELLLACLWVWAAWCAATRRHAAAAMLVGLGVLARPEGVIAAGLWPVLVAVHGRQVGRRFTLTDLALRIAVPLAFPAAAWWLAGALAYHDAVWLVHRWPWAGASVYGKTPLMFVLAVLTATAGWLLLAAGLGFRAALKAASSPAKAHALWLIALPTVGYFLMHGLFGGLGLFGSMSLPRYFVPLAPFLAILACLGLATIRRVWVPRLAAALAMTPLVLLAIAGQFPLAKGTDLSLLDAALVTLPSHAPDTLLIAAHPWFYYRMDRGMTAAEHAALHRTGLANAPAGTLVLTDSVVWDKGGSPSATDLAGWGYVPLPAVNAALDAVPQRRALATLTEPQVRVRAYIKQAAP